MKLNLKQISKLFTSHIAENIVSFTAVNMTHLDTNQIFIITTDKNKYVLKILSDKQNLGEEDMFDILYDCKVHEVVNLYLNNMLPSREVLAFGNVNNLSSTHYVIHTFIDGILATNCNNKKQIITDIWETLKKVYIVFGPRTSPGLIDFNAFNFEQNKVLGFIESRYPTRASVNYTQRCFDFYCNDVKMFSPPKFRKKLLETGSKLYTNTSQINQGKLYFLIHADLKLSNVIEKDGNINIFDWSKAHYGDPLIDFCDLLLLTQIYLGSDSAYTFLNNTELQIDLNKTEIENLIKFYIFYKVFSIARVFSIEHIENTCKDITKNLPVLEFLNLQPWLNEVMF